MNNRHYAAIDIGSNAVRLLIKRVSRNVANGEEKLSKEILLRVPLRLGFDVFSKGKISKDKSKKLLRLMKSYRQLMEIYGVTRYRACATSAMRDSRNGFKLIRSIKKKAGIRIDIIDGQEEARMIYDNHLECVEDRKGNYMYVDVGGGSTEVNLLAEGELVYSRSFNIGTVRLLTGGVTEAAWTRMGEEIKEQARQFGTINIIGSGGNINKLYKLIDKKDKKRKQFSIGALQEIYDQLAPMSDQARMDAFDLKPDRADVIVPAARIFLFIAQTIHAEHIYVPVIGLSDGIIDSLYAEDLEKYNQKACRDAGAEALAAGEDAPCQDCGCDAEPAEAPVPTAGQFASAVPAAGCAAPKRTDDKPAAE